MFWSRERIASDLRTPHRHSQSLMPLPTRTRARTFSDASEPGPGTLRDMSVRGSFASPPLFVYEPDRPMDEKLARCTGSAAMHFVSMLFSSPYYKKHRQALELVDEAFPTVMCSVLTERPKNPVRARH